MKQAATLLLDFNPTSGLGLALREVLESEMSSSLRLRHEYLCAGDPEAVAQELSDLILCSCPDLVFLILAPGFLKLGRLWLQSLSRAEADAPIMLVVDAGEPDELFAWLEMGVVDFITPPLKAIDLIPRVRRLPEQPRGDQALTRRLKKTLGLKQIIGESPVFRATIDKLPLVAQCDASVLISGETGTGKDLRARVIHYLSSRARHPFVPVNCGAIPAELVENELFGHERGAFTGASHAQPGLIREAGGGTLFLDEIDCLPLLAQVKLLRFLQEKEYRPLGSTKTLQADVRVIAAANTNPEESMRSGKLRQDLYYRLNVISLRLPSLRERPEDIAPLARHFLAKYAAEFRKPASSLSAGALQKLRLYDWPGNVRELEHSIASAVAMAGREVIESDDLNLPCEAKETSGKSYREAKARFERAYVEDLLSAHQGNITKAAQAAHKNRRAFWELIRKHRIDVASFKANAKSRSAAG
jgi:DNA-binding NtrC family response regulator